LNIIKRKSDIDNLLKNMRIGSKIEVESCFSGYGLGFYTFTKVNNDTFKTFNYAQNWRDREISIVDIQFVIDRIWENRKFFNERIRAFKKIGLSIIEYY
jgi:hypothetical protein